MKKTTLILVMLISAHVHATSPNIPTEFLGSRIATYSPRGLLKNWALSTCFSRIAKNTEDKTDAKETADAYANFGKISNKEQEIILPIIDKYIAKKYGGHETKAEYHTEKCVDIVLSDEFETLVTNLLRIRQNKTATVTGYPDNSGNWNYSQRNITKNYALFSCLFTILKDEEMRSDAASCSSANLQMGVLEFEDYPILDKFSESFIKKKYGGRNPSKFNTMKCIDLYYSPELERLVTRLLSKEKEQLRKTKGDF
ncbi:MAG: type VI secretion system amidase immunity protein Tai4 [Azoarcus sp.]|nr:type VI secretion system amidase immunity protein Tai4 [Azoarcus sp.]